jgi:hypothetical protein
MMAVVVSCIMLASLTILYKDNRKGNLGYPYAGGSGWEPSFFLRLRFVLGAGRIIREGYSKVNRASLSRPNIKCT